MSTPPPENPQDHRLANTSGWIGGAVLILLGVVFLLQNVSDFELHNWWALFILIPAAGAFSRAWTTYQSEGGRFTSQARGSLFGGVILLMVAAAFLFSLNWSLLFPVLLMLAGASLLINGMRPD